MGSFCAPTKGEAAPCKFQFVKLMPMRWSESSQVSPVQKQAGVPSCTQPVLLGNGRLPSACWKFEKACLMA